MMGSQDLTTLDTGIKVFIKSASGSPIFSFMPVPPRNTRSASFQLMGREKFGGTISVKKRLENKN